MLTPTRRQENKLYADGYTVVAGADEAGRGAWAGPIVAAAVVLPQRGPLSGIRESKQLTARAREQWYERICDLALAYQIVMIAEREIDRVGIAEANRAALRHALTELSTAPSVALVDALPIGEMDFPVQSIIKGDTAVVSIAAASILAKVARDRYMIELHRQYPRYGFDRHKGYGAAIHYERLLQYGVSPVHRRSFRPMVDMVGRSR